MFSSVPRLSDSRIHLFPGSYGSIIYLSCHRTFINFFSPKTQNSRNKPWQKCFQLNFWNLSIMFWTIIILLPTAVLWNLSGVTSEGEELPDDRLSLNHLDFFPFLWCGLWICIPDLSMWRKQDDKSYIRGQREAICLSSINYPEEVGQGVIVYCETLSMS